jgi:disulfide bond formation protein DsbB
MEVFVVMKKMIFRLAGLLAVLGLAACGGDAAEESPYSAEMISAGETTYMQTCFACHGPDAKGLPNLGKDLTTSEFFKTGTDGEMLAYILAGRAVDDPLNTTGIAMPPKGGFDFLTETDILNVIAFLRTLQE